jgi:hypothetical protein
MDALEGDEGHGRPADTLKKENDLYEGGTNLWN